MARASRSGVISSHRTYSRGHGERGWARHYDQRPLLGSPSHSTPAVFTIILAGIKSFNRWVEATRWRRTRRGSR